MCENNASVSLDMIDGFSAAFNEDAKARLAANASVKNGLIQAATDYKALQKLPYSFSVDLKQGRITNQRSSGRCWLFSALNTFRYEMIKKYELDDMELSQSYMFFYDKLEKANYFLESVLKTTDEEVDGRLYSFISRDPIGDGGQWDLLVNLVDKYGVVPKSVYPDSANDVASSRFDQYLTSLLREYAIKLRKDSKAGASIEELRDAKLSMMKNVYRILCICLGEPPKTFDYTLTDKNGKVYREFGISGKEFYAKYVGLDLNEYICLVNAPADNKPMNRTYTVKFLGNVIEGNDVKYLNLDMDIIKKAVIAQLKDSHPVWFGSDCTFFSLRDEAVFDRASADVEGLFDIHYDFTKGERLMYGDSAMNHAMVFLGVNLDKDGNADRWRIENSWGEDAGANKGYFTASDSWFDEFVYQVAVNRKYLSEDVIKLIDQPVIELEPWDPLGTLAK